MDEETLRILEMVQQGQITPEQAAKLLDAIESAPEAPSPQTQQRRRFRVVVTDKASGQNRINVSIPMALLDMAARIRRQGHGGEGPETKSQPGVPRADELDELWDIDLRKLLEEIRGAQDGKIFEADLEDGRKTHHVMVFIE